MKTKIKASVSLVLCMCILLSVGITGLAAERETASVSVPARSYASIEDYIAEVEAAGKTVTVLDADGTVLEASAPAAKSAAAQEVTPIQAGLKGTLAKIINFISDFLINKVVLGALHAVLPTTSAVLDKAAFDVDEYDDFYTGTDTFLTAPAPGAGWKLGYAQRSILPDDFGVRPYKRGSMVPYAATTETFDDLRVRTIVLDDGSGRGSVVFAVLDVIGLANADVRKIRAAVADFAAANNIVSINIGVTHTHSGIDSQGVWNDPAGTILNNFVSAWTGLVEVKSGVDATFLQTMIDRTAESIVEAFNNKTAGTMTYAQKDVADYVRDRTPPYALDSNLYRLMFTPTNAALKPTLIATFGCHPETTSFSFKEISADFVHYMEEVVNLAGYNFIYIQGNVGTVTTSRGKTNDGLPLNDYEMAVRYGHELGYIALGMTMTQAQCQALNVQCGDLLGVAEYADREGYSIWYEDWEPVTATAVAPLLNIRHEQFLIKVDNNVLNALGRTSIANNLFLYDKATRSFYSATELGYMEIGTQLPIMLNPGEILGELLIGGDGLKGFKYPALRDSVAGNLIIFDLMNDAIGYIAADPNYVMVGYQYDPKRDSFESDSWCMISFGKNTGSTIIGRFNALVESVR